MHWSGVQKFIDDGSYNLVDRVDAEIATSFLDHSSFIDPTRTDTIFYKAKLEVGPVSKHPWFHPFSDLWPAENRFWARAHDVPNEHSTLSEALSASKNSQTVNINTDYILSNSSLTALLFPQN